LERLVSGAQLRIRGDGIRQRGMYKDEVIHILKTEEGGLRLMGGKVH